MRLTPWACLVAVAENECPGCWAPDRGNHCVAARGPVTGAWSLAPSLNLTVQGYPASSPPPRSSLRIQALDPKEPWRGLTVPPDAGRSAGVRMDLGQPISAHFSAHLP